MIAYCQGIRFSFYLKEDQPSAHLQKSSHASDPMMVSLRTEIKVLN
jgi:hypothetical protein